MGAVKPVWTRHAGMLAIVARDGLIWVDVRRAEGGSFTRMLLGPEEAVRIALVLAEAAAKATLD